MLRALAYSLPFLLLLACHSLKKTQASNKPIAVKLIGDEYRPIAERDCITCHKVNERTIGPSFAMVSERYKPSDAMIEKLAHKIMTGGSGNWGTIPMTPHPDLSLDSAKAIVKIILSLRNQ